jgi:hypothetical protein
MIEFLLFLVLLAAACYSIDRRLNELRRRLDALDGRLQALEQRSISQPVTWKRA